MEKLTPQQKEAVESRGCSIIVSAAAGSGKTKVLTQRLSDMLADKENRIRADRIAVVTFTKAAASEMKNRLDRNLRERMSSNPSDSYLANQQILLQNASISTINAFCFDLLRDNISEQGITSEFGVIEDTENEIIKEQAMDELINYYSENEYDKVSYLYDCFCMKNEKGLADAINEIDEFLSSVPFRKRWLDGALKSYRVPFAESVYFKKLREYCISELEKMPSVIESYRSMLEDIFFGDTDSKKYIQFRDDTENDFRCVERMLEFFKSGFGKEPVPKYSFNDIRMSGVKDYDKELWKVFKEKKRDVLKKKIKDIQSMAENAEYDMAESAKITEILIEMVKKYEEIIWEKKCSRNAISFDDGERLMLEILAKTDDEGNILRTETAEKISEYYDVIMIDEYQDSNNKQDLIFRLISKDCISENGKILYGSNVFIVGDVKQSIYRFRLANPQNFIDTANYFRSNRTVNREIDLNKNFRSSNEVIDFVNFIFGNIMSADCGDIDYSDSEKLYFGAERYNDGKGSKRLAHISFIDDVSEESDSETDDESEFSEDREAFFTAKKIADMVNSGTEVVLDSGISRKCTYSDFCILARSNRHIAVYSKALKKMGIPVKTKEESGYLKSRETAVLADLLRVINNPLNDVPLTAVMASPMYMFSISEIALIRSVNKEIPLFSAVSGVAEGEYGDIADEGLKNRCRDLVKSVEKFRLDSVTMTVSELINSIYETTDFISVMQMNIDGDRNRANLRLFANHANSYEKSVSDSSGGLSGFIRHMDKAGEGSSYSKSNIALSSGDYVSVMTLHGSKGLEFPFVFIVETSGKFRFDSKAVMCSSDGTVGYCIYKPEYVKKYRTFQQFLIAEQEKRNLRSEEMRILYVGLTRAKQQLFVNMKSDESSLKRVKALIERCSISGGISECVKDALSFSDWLWLCLMKHREFGRIAEQLGLESTDFSDCNGSIFEFEVCNEKFEGLISSEEQAEEAEPDEKVYSELKKIINCDYDLSLSEMSAKLTVTQILEKFRGTSEGFGMTLKQPKFLTDTGKLTGAERGTAIHTFFQYCNFENAKRSISDEVKRVADMGYISRVQADSINLKNASSFFNSSIFRRICSSHTVWREKKFMVSLSELDLENSVMNGLKSSGGVLRGIIDLMFEDTGGIVLVDYKSDRGVTEQKLRDMYTMQLRLYRSAVELMMKRKVSEAYLYSFELRKEVKVDI